MALTMTRRRACGLAVGVLACAAAAQDPVIRRIAVHGDDAPGAPAGVTFFDTSFETNFPSFPLIDDSGGVSFHAVLTGPGIDPSMGGNADTLYTHVKGKLTLLARQGERAPGAAAGVVFQGFPLGLGPQAPLLSEGRTVFLGTLRGPGVVDENMAGLWTDRSGSVELFVRAGDPVPGAPGGCRLQGAATPRINAAGRITFHASFRVPGQSAGEFIPDHEGVWSDRSGTIQRLIGGGDAAPGTGPGITFGEGAFFAIDGAFRGWDLDGAGRIAFHGNLAGPGIDDLNDEGIWFETATGHQLLLREGDAAPGFGAGGRIGIVSGIDAFGSRFPIDVNESGQLLFMARVDPPGQVSFAEGVYVRRGQGIELVAQGRDSSASEPGPQAPGLAPGMYFRAFGWGNLSNSGRVALVAATTNLGGSVQGSGIWWDQSGPLTMLAANDVQAPGFDQGVIYQGNFQIGPLTGAGSLLFAASVGGPNFPSRRVIFVTDENGTAHAILMAGQQIDVSPLGMPADLRVASDFLIGSIGENGEVVFKVLFADNTIAVLTAALGTGCYPNCDGSSASPVLTANDFQCFLDRYAANDPYANCDGSTGTPALTANDFQCFINGYAAGCS